MRRTCLTANQSSTDCYAIAEYIWSKKFKQNFVQYFIVSRKLWDFCLVMKFILMRTPGSDQEEVEVRGAEGGKEGR